jgi:hypothetical protein
MPAGGHEVADLREVRGPGDTRAVRLAHGERLALLEERQEASERLRQR